MMIFKVDDVVRMYDEVRRWKVVSLENNTFGIKPMGHSGFPWSKDNKDIYWFAGPDDTFSKVINNKPFLPDWL